MHVCGRRFPMLTRRHFLAATALSSATILTRTDRYAVASPFETPLPLPQLIDATTDRKVKLVAAQGTHAYRQGQVVASFGYSAPVLGPVIRIARSQITEFTVENRTNSPTTVHWHGLIIPSSLDGGPHNEIAPR